MLDFYHSHHNKQFYWPDGYLFWEVQYLYNNVTMTSWHGNVDRITVHLWGEYIPRKTGECGLLIAFKTMHICLKYWLVFHYLFIKIKWRRISRHDYVFSLEDHTKYIFYCSWIHSHPFHLATFTREFRSRFKLTQIAFEILYRVKWISNGFDVLIVSESIHCKQLV